MMFAVKAALPAEAEVLTRIAHDAKRHWGYPEAWIARWASALTVTADDLRLHPTWVAVRAEQPVGFALVKLAADDATLEHLWVRPEWHGQGIGRALFVRAEAFARARGATRLRLVSDPHAQAFYRRMGAVVCGQESADIEGIERRLLRMEKLLPVCGPSSKLRPLAPMLAIFDNDGTICDSQAVEAECYAEAILRVTGRPLATVDWNAYPECTSSAIVREFLVGDPDAAAKEAAIEQDFVQLLEEARPTSPADFTPLPGAVEFLARLRRENICAVAIATGCFAASARFKLRCCGLDLDAFPHATSSDTPTRRTILPLAATRAGFAIKDAVYFADGQWDVRAARELGIPMIGIGRRIEHLRSLGVEHVFRDYTEAPAILDALKEIARQRQGSRSDAVPFTGGA